MGDKMDEPKKKKRVYTRSIKPKTGFLSFKCSPELQRSVEHTADALNVGVSEFLREVVGRAVGGYSGRIKNGLSYNQLKGSKNDRPGA